MKTFALLCVVLVAEIQANVVRFPPEQENKVIQLGAECIQETGVKLEVLAELRKGNVIDDEALKKFAFCFFKKSGIIDDDGKLDIDLTLAKMPPGIDKAEDKKLLETCKSKTGKDVAETVYEIYKCYHYGSRIHIFIPF